MEVKQVSSSVPMGGSRRPGGGCGLHCSEPHGGMTLIGVSFGIRCKFYRNQVHFLDLVKGRYEYG